MTSPSHDLPFPAEPPELGPKPTGRGSVRAALRWLVGATVVLYVALGALALQTRHTASVNTDALCALRGDLQTRVDASTKFLKEHPRGFPGVGAVQIQMGIDNQQRTIDALSGIEC